MTSFLTAEYDANTNQDFDPNNPGGANNPTTPMSVTVNSSQSALTVTQIGTGLAFLVEDATSPDSTPFAVDAAGNIGVGILPLASAIMTLAKPLTGAAGVSGLFLSATVLQDATTNAFVFRSSVGTQAAAFVLPELIHYFASQAAIGAGSSVSNQYGYRVASNIIGATNNYGYYGEIPAGAGRFNIYMTGTAANYLAGELGIGIIPSTSSQLTMAAGTAAKSSMRIPHGAAPTAPVDGDMWTTSAGLFIRINGVTRSVNLT